MPQRNPLDKPLPTLADIERRVIELRMIGFDGDKRAVAKSLGICLSTLYQRLHRIRVESKRRTP